MYATDAVTRPMTAWGGVLPASKAIQGTPDALKICGRSPQRVLVLPEASGSMPSPNAVASHNCLQIVARAVLFFVLTMQHYFAIVTSWRSP